MAIFSKDIHSLSMIWWNVSLSPPKTSNRTQAPKEKMEHIARVINYLIEKGYDLICLGEVSMEDMRILSELLYLSERKYSYVEGADQQGRLYFDTGIIYSSKLSIQRQENGSYCYHDTYNVTDRNKVKLFERYVFRFNQFEDIIVLYLSHWPSQLRNSEINTTHIAINLKNQIREILSENSNVILMGDYNLEPYDKCIVELLGSSRDKKQVKENTTLLYNPCWGLLTPKNNESIGGSYFYKSGYHHRWKVLDQCMFSKSFLEKPWLFDDSFVSIIDFNLIDAEDIGQNPSDHWPISCTIFRI